MGQNTFAEKIGKKGVDFWLAAALIVLLAIILILPFKTRVAVVTKCTHGEVISVKQKTVWRFWWLEPFVSNEIVETTLCPKHLQEEQKYFKEGLKWYNKGAYELAIYKFVQITELNPDYEKARSYIVKAKEHIKVERAAAKVTKSIKGYEYLLPDEIGVFSSEPPFVANADGYEFLGTVYRPKKIGFTPEIQVSVYLFDSPQEASQFVSQELYKRYPEARGTKKIRKVKVYFGYGEPYVAAVFTYDAFVYELVAVGRTADSEKIRDLQTISEFLIKVAEL